MRASIPIGEFKAHCYQLLNQVQKDHGKLIVTKRGIQIAEVIPIRTASSKEPFIGAMQGRAQINGDLIAPIPIIWDAENE